MVVPGQTCEGVLVMRRTLTCTFDKDTDTLTIENGFATLINSGTTISFRVTSLKNPLSFQPVKVTVSTYNEDGTGMIDTSEEGTIKASTQAAIDPSKV